MKLKDLVEQHRVIEGSVRVPRHVEKLDYEGAIVKGSFVCVATKIKSLKGAPRWVGGRFSCSRSAITSLEGAPEYVGGRFTCITTKITSLHNVHKVIKHIGSFFTLSNTIKSHVLGVMMIKGLVSISFYDRTQKQEHVENIINKHLKGDRNIHDCQEELLEVGFTEYAKL